MTARDKEPSPVSTLRRPESLCRRFVRRAAIELAKALALALVSATLGLAVNAARGREGGGIDLVARAPYDLYTDCPEMDARLSQIDVASLRPGNRWLIILDARPSVAFVAGHIPGALSMPMYGTRPNTGSRLAQVMRAWFRPVVVYGADPLQSGVHLGSWLRQQGRPWVLVLRGGLSAWRAAGRPVATTRVPAIPAKAARTLRGARFVDARPPEVFRAGHVRGALSLPFNGLVPPDPKRFAALLAETRPLVIYGVEGVDPELADPESDSAAKDVGRLLAAELLALGAHRVQFLTGGVAAWQEAGGPVQRQAAPPKPEGGRP